MILVDVNVLVYAHRKDSADHDRYRNWLEQLVAGDLTYGMADQVLAGFLRVVTHPKVFADPTPVELALEFVSQIRNSERCVVVRPGVRHWGIFTRLVAACGARGNLVPDAYLAALAMEHGCVWITTDRDFARFPGLQWRHPLA